jgi:aminoglycoside phosphotransferase (APT) family kinase protein
MVDAVLFGELQTLCQRSFPSRLDQSITQIKSLGGGRHPSVSLSLAWREGRRPRVERLVVRQYADPWTWWAVDDRQKAQREWTVMCWLFGRGLPIPQPYASGTEGEYEYLMMPLVPGDPAEATDRGHVEALAALLAQIHRLTPPEAVRQALPGVLPARELARLRDLAFRCQVDGLLEATTELYGQMHAALHAELHAETVEETNRETSEAPPLCVLHGDPRLVNVRCDAQGITAVLNWENAALGDPRWDIARVVNDLRSQQADQLAEHFCAVYAERSGEPLVDVDFWETLTATQSWALVEWVRQEGAAGGAGAALLDEREAWQERAWRSLTRLRHARGQVVVAET